MTPTRRALDRLDRLARLADRLALELPPSFGADPLGPLTSAPLDEALLADVLDRIAEPWPEPATSVGRASRSRARRRRRPAAEARRSALAPVRDEAGHAALLAEAQPVTASRAGPAPPPTQVSAATAAGPLAAVAARVPGGAHALVTPVGGSALPGEEAPDVVDRVVAAALDAALAPAPARVEDPAPRRFRAPLGGEGGAPRLARDDPSVADGAGPTRRLAPLAAAPLPGAARAGAPVDPLPARHGASGLVELVRRWERAQPGGEPVVEAAAAPAPAGPAPVATAPRGTGPGDEPPPRRAGDAPVTEDELARALERLLAGELRRYGIEPEAG